MEAIVTEGRGVDRRKENQKNSTWKEKNRRKHEKECEEKPMNVKTLGPLEITGFLLTASVIPGPAGIHPQQSPIP